MCHVNPMAYGFCDMGWSPAGLGRRMDRVYQIQDRETGQWRYFGELFRNSVGQQRYANVAIRNLRRGGPVRIVVLKGRKPGISTMVGCLQYDIITHTSGQDAVVLAHTRAATDTLFRMVKKFHEKTPEELRPQIASKNGTRMVFDVRYMAQREAGETGIEASYECATAGGDNPFTGATPRAAHIAEAGKMPGDNHRQIEIMTSVLNAVPTNGPSIVTMEGTAQGWGNLFHQTWQEAEYNMRNGRIPDPGEWIGVFVGWWEDQLNQMIPSPDYRWDDWDADDIEQEKELISLYWKGDFHLAAPYLRWRRNKIKQIGNDFAKFDEDYPHCPRVAFLRSGRPAIPPKMFDYLNPLVSPPRLGSWTGSLVEPEKDDAYGISAVSGW